MKIHYVHAYCHMNLHNFFDEKNKKKKKVVNQNELAKSFIENSMYFDKRDFKGMHHANSTLQLQHQQSILYAKLSVLLDAHAELIHNGIVSQELIDAMSCILSEKLNLNVEFMNIFNDIQIRMRVFLHHYTLLHRVKADI